MEPDRSFAPRVPVLLSVGHGYVARALACLLLPAGWRIVATTRSPETARALARTGVEPMLWNGGPLPLDGVTHLLSSVPPGEAGDPVLNAAGEGIARAGLVWAGYLSTTAVYGDRAGGWVDEETPPAPGSARARGRLAAERAWADLPGLPWHLFRLAGIYGPGRTPFAALRAGTARAVVKPRQVFSRIHVADLAQVLAASMARPEPGQIYTVADDLPAPPQEVLRFAAGLLGLPPPPEVAFEEAGLSPMGRSFYAECRRVRNDRIKRALGVRLLYPDYRSGLRACLAEEAG